LTSEAKRRLEREGRWTGGSRLAAQFSRPKETAPGCLLAFRVLVPESAVSIDSAAESLPVDLIWTPPPPQDRAVDIALIMTAPGAQTDGWPGRSAMSHREVPIPVISPAQARISRFEPAPEYSQPLENARVLVGINVDGAPSAVMECRVDDTCFDRKDPAAGEPA
jgi:hypothetical protein